MSAHSVATNRPLGHKNNLIFVAFFTVFHTLGMSVCVCVARIVWVLAVWVCAIFLQPLPPCHLKMMSRCSYWTGSPVGHNLHHRLNELNVHSQAAGVYRTCTRRAAALSPLDSKAICKGFGKESCKMRFFRGEAKVPDVGFYAAFNHRRETCTWLPRPGLTLLTSQHRLSLVNRPRVVIRPKVLRASKCGAEPRSGAAASKNRNRFPSLIGDKL